MESFMPQQADEHVMAGRKGQGKHKTHRQENPRPPQRASFHGALRQCFAGLWSVLLRVARSTDLSGVHFESTVRCAHYPRGVAFALAMASPQRDAASTTALRLP